MQQSLTTGKPRAKLELVAEIMLLCPDKHHSSDVVYWRRRDKSGKGWAWLRRPQVAMHSQLPRFLVIILMDGEADANQMLRDS